MEKDTAIQSFLPTSKVWVYQSDRELSPEEMDAISLMAGAFVREWAAHGSKLKAGFQIKYNRFIILIADESLTMTSGCSIDQSISFIRAIENRFNLVLLDRMKVAYKSSDGIKTISMADFGEKLKSKELSSETIVFNNLVATMAELQDKWEVPVTESWHKMLL